MKNIKYFLQFLIIIALFTFYRFLGLNLSSKLSGHIMYVFGPLFRSNKIAVNNIKKALPQSTIKERRIILKRMWHNYGKIFSEYMFLRKFRNSPDFSKNILIKNHKILEEIKTSNEPVIFISGHFNNFELMAMYLDKFGINLAAIYRPLNNKFLNPIMEYIRKNYICNNQVKKGVSGTKQLLKHFKNNVSIALMIDQRISQGIKSNFFNEPAYTTTIPAQFVKKFNVKVVPIYIERFKDNKFNLEIYEPLIFNKKYSVQQITDELNQLLEKMILKNPDQWIWTHNRWK
jgi:KDO2-lipid IV(A) lauroyltransferase